MKIFENMRVYAWCEFVVWIILISVTVLGVRYYHYKTHKQTKNYQIFIEDADGLIVGSPVRFCGTQIGYVKKIQIVSTEVYVNFVITQKDLTLPTGSIATVEAYGLGGSKSLEIYPPDKTVKTDKLIVSKEPMRLGKAFSLFKSMFKELDSIISTVGHASSEFGIEEESGSEVFVENERISRAIKL